MPITTLNEVMQLASALRIDEKEMLIEVMKRQRAESWRKNLARSARQAEKDYRTGKLQAESAESLVARLRADWAKASHDA